MPVARSVIGSDAGEWDRYDELIRETFAIWEFRRSLDAESVVALLGAVGQREPLDVKAVVERLLEMPPPRAERRRLNRLLVSYMTAVAGNRRPPRGLLRYLRQMFDAAMEELAAVPPSLAKAERYLAVLADWGRLEDTEFEALAFTAQVTDSTIEALIDEWRAAWDEHRQRMRRDQLTGQTFWVSADHQGLFDDIARYRCYERFELEEFTQVFVDVERQLGESLLGIASSLDPFGVSPGPWMDVGMAPLMLWELSRTERLPVALGDAIGLVLRGLGHRQHPDGWWPSVLRTERNERYPDATATAAAAVAILKLSSSDDLRQQALTAVEWLVATQLQDGSWSPYGSAPPVGDEPSVLGVALAAEAIARSARRGSQRILARAAKWLIAQQDPRGTWSEAGLQPPALTAAVLEALAASSAPPTAGLRAVRAMLRRSRQLAVEDSLEARQLSVIAAHAALEAFVYALLERPAINVKVWDGSRTIGLSAALPKLQEALAKSKNLQRGETLVRRNDVERLVYFRNEVIHKGVAISASELDGLIDAAREFVATHGQQVLGHNDLP